MSAAEIKQYEEQLSQVQGALKADPSNEELVNLEGELKNLIALTKQILGHETAAAASSSSSAPSAAQSASSDHAPPKSSSQKRALESEPSSLLHVQQQGFVAGDEVQAKYNADGRWYPARIVSVAGAGDRRQYTVIFKGYKTTEVLSAEDVRAEKGVTYHRAGGNAGAAASSAPAARPSNASSTKRGEPAVTLTPEEEAERERKRKRNEKKAERYADKAAETTAKANSWKSFAKKGEKKGIIKGGSKSMFATPDDPLARVGVVGAGRGMTSYDQRKKHLYDGDGTRES